jgi:hypothetical protein
VHSEKALLSTRERIVPEHSHLNGVPQQRCSAPGLVGIHRDRARNADKEIETSA